MTAHGSRATRLDRAARTPRAGSAASADRADLVVVGAGVVGLGHAVRAVERGLSVVVVDREDRATGASVRNFGHSCLTAQRGVALRHGVASREAWVRLAADAGFWLRECGTVVVARHDDEVAVLEEFATARGDDDVRLLDADEVRARVPLGPGALGGAWLPRDLRVDPRAALPAIAAWLAGRGVRFHWSTSVAGVDADGATTSRGRLDAGAVVVAVGHDVGHLYPEVAERAGVVRCALHMLTVAAPDGAVIDPAVLTGWSLLRYDGFSVSPSLGAVRERLARQSPQAVTAGLHLMLTQRPDGDLVIGDTHTLAATTSPFQREELDELVLAEAAALLGADRLRVRERWQGVYAKAPEPFLVAAPTDTTRVVSVTTGIGMTTAFGLAADVVDDLVA